MYLAIDKRKIRQRLDLLELKHWWVAEMIGVNPSTLKRWLNGRINAARDENVERLAQMLGTSSEEILTKRIKTLN